MTSKKGTTGITELQVIDRALIAEQSTNQTVPRRFKVVVLGNSSVGKTSLLGRIISRQFGEYGSTIGGDIYLKTIKVDIGAGGESGLIHEDADPLLASQSSVQLLFYDTSGNQRYSLLLPDAMAKASAAIIVYDATDRRSFDAVDMWLEKFRNSVSACSLVILVANKIDLTAENISNNENNVETVEGEEKASRLNVLFCQVSAKSGKNADELTRLLGSSLMASAVNQRLVLSNPPPPPAPVSSTGCSKIGKPTKSMAASESMFRGDQFPQLFKFKIALLGERAVGKTSMLTQFLYNCFDSNYQSTIGIDFFSKNVYIDGRTVRLQLWDTAGQERFRSLIPSYIRNSSAAIIVYDVSDRHSFSQVKYWVDEVRCERGSDAVIMLAANKVDLRTSSNEAEPSGHVAPNPSSMVTTQEGEAKAREIGAFFTEVSAKTGYNVQQLFHRMAAALPESVVMNQLDGGQSGCVVNVEAVSTDETTGAGSANSSCYC